MKNVSRETGIVYKRNKFLWKAVSAKFHVSVMKLYLHECFNRNPIDYLI